MKTPTSGRFAGLQGKVASVLSLCVLTSLILFPAASSAYTVEQLAVSETGDFVMSPGKTEIVVEPGETLVKQIAITSRIAGVSHFKVTAEDFVGSDDPGKAVVLLGDERGPYSLVDYIVPEIDEFSLSLGEKITIPITISIPEDAEPGGVYGAVLVQSDPRTIDGTSGQARVVSRLGSLFLVRIEGEMQEEGTVADFRVKSPQRWFHEKGPIRFEILYENRGTVHLVPYGSIEVQNTLGTVVADIPVDAYFTLPDSLRFREVVWNSDRLLGRYTATLTMYPGFGDADETRSVSFWVLPWKVLLGGFAGLFIVIYLIYFIGSRFEFKRKSK